MSLPTASVAVVTFERPDFVARCLDHLMAQTVAPLEVIVVDSSLSQDTATLVRARYPWVRFEVCTAGRGATATARNIAFEHATGEILAFLDDDAFAEPDWLEQLLPLFDDPAVGGVGGRQIRGQPDELTEGVDSIGRLLDDGTLTGNFAADSGVVLEVDHLLGANMAFRRSVIEAMGGIRDGYAGTCMREETDLCLRVVHAGYHLLYTPNAVVEHVAAPYAKGQRFDLRYAYWAQKNHLILLIRNFGLGAPVVRRYLRSSTRGTADDFAVRTRRAVGRAKEHDGAGAVKAGAAALLRTGVALCATCTGLVTGVQLTRSDRRGH